MKSMGYADLGGVSLCLECSWARERNGGRRLSITREGLYK